MPRTIWKGAISFGLVHVPIVVHAATRPQRLDFDWIDRRDDAPIGYQRINKRTGKPVASEDIVKGYEYEKGEYVYMNDEDFKRANVAATQTVEIQGFVDAAEVPIYYYDTPYYLAPDRRGEKATCCCARCCARPAGWGWRAWCCTRANTCARCCRRATP